MTNDRAGQQRKENGVTEEKNRRESSGPKDALDLGVPMAPGEGPQEGPEDALDPNARGDYTGRLGGGASYQSQVVGYREDGSPIIEMVRQK
jgi:hypothetical protein